MMYSRFTKLSILFMLGIACANVNYTYAQVGSQKKVGSKKTSSIQHAIPTNVDSNFETFLKYFSKDSLFQVSRIKFPLRFKDPDNKVQFIQKSEYLKLDFDEKTAKTRRYDAYNQVSKVEGNKAKIEIRGIENGIFSNVYFEKIGKKWMLVNYVDSSN